MNAQISYMIAAQLICPFVFAIKIRQFLYLLNPKFQASRHLLFGVVLDPITNPNDKFSLDTAQITHYVNVSVLIKFSQKTSLFTLIIISSP